jgi:hypothetical protein
MDLVRLIGVESSLQQKHPKCRREIKARGERLRKLGDKQMPETRDDDLLRSFKSYIAGLPCAQLRPRPVKGKKKQHRPERVDRGRFKSGR